MRRAVQSVLDQDYDGAIEVIVVFDACEPFLPEVEHGPSRAVRVVTNTRTRGLAGARNTGILGASHDFVAFLDDDDTWLPAKLGRQMDRFEQSPSAVLVGTAMSLDDGEHTHERLVPTSQVTHADLLRDRMPGLHSSTFVFRTAPLRDPLGMVDEALPGSYGEDYDLLLRTALLAPIEVVNASLVRVTWSQSSYFFGRWGAYAEGLEYLLRTHEGFSADRVALGRIASQIAFARAANGDRAVARSWVWRAVRSNPTQVKAWLALGIACRVLSAGLVVRVVQRLGKGI
ncbi:glycosyltransferase family 2 protein [Nocardioides dongxiaopingii]|uniref:glycosyltransferase family 2 protein n=1 Tax=Nocardioides sp. S-1144 TaxID=2582905 RepID=UPI00110F3FB7|nr:glycosyltransferase family 2 protein [Nocardioides sp. S-1144]QCW51443.1 glycosyltransferase family 2 protein [Nocardioides sp. S-1144]